jgi:hypothetical protein
MYSCVFETPALMPNGLQGPRLKSGYLCKKIIFNCIWNLNGLGKQTSRSSVFY